MPDYSLNWTARSSAIQGGQRCQWCSSPTQQWPSRSRRPFDLKSDFAGQCQLRSKPPQINAVSLVPGALPRGDTDYLPHPPAVSVGMFIFVSASHQTGLDPSSITRRSIIVGSRGGEDRAQSEARALLVYAGHRFTQCNVSLMSLAEPQDGPRHGCLIIA